MRHEQPDPGSSTKPLLVSTEKALWLLGEISRRHLEKIRDIEGIAHVKLGGRTLYVLASIEEFVARKAQEASRRES